MIETSRHDLRRLTTVEQLAQDIRDKMADGGSDIEILMGHEAMLDIVERLLAVERVVHAAIEIEG